MKGSSSSVAFLACDVFSDELTAFGVKPERVRWLEMGLHDQPDNLRKHIHQELEIIESDLLVETIVMAYGRCGNGLVGVKAGRCQLVLPQAHDCISILLGGKQQHEQVLAEEPGTYFYSPGWIRGKRVPGPDREQHLREFYQERYGDDEEMIDELVEVDLETYEHHNCAAYVDITENQSAEDYCRGCAKHMGWQFKKLEADPAYLKDLVEQNWEDDRFLIVPPGNRIRLLADGKMGAECPA